MLLRNLFAKNPFAPLRQHMDKTLECVAATEDIFAKLLDGDKEGVAQCAKTLSHLEYEADNIKHEIRSRLTTSVFLPVDRRDVLNILSHLDAVADQAEDIGVLLTLRWMELPAELNEPFKVLRVRVQDVVLQAAEVIKAFDGLLDGGFSGPDVERILAQVDEVGRLEHQADKAQDQFGKELFRLEDEMKPAALFMWIKIANKVGDMANAAERMVNQLRIMLSP